MKVQKYFFVFFWLIALLGLAIGQRDMDVFEETYSVKGDEFQLDLDIDGGKVKLDKNDSGDECHVYVEYHRKKCDCDVHFNEHRNRLEVTLDHDWSIKNDKRKRDSDYAYVSIELPYEPKITLDAKIKAGEVDFELGGIHLQDCELRNWAGEITLNFDEPNRTKLLNFDVNVKVGELSMYNLGNANFQEADINGGIGEMTLDFRGETIDYTTAYIDLDIGETTIIVPEEIGVKMKVSKFLFLSNVDYPNWFDRRGKYYYSENYNENEKNLYLVISTGIGELKIRVK